MWPEPRRKAAEDMNQRIWVFVHFTDITIYPVNIIYPIASYSLIQLIPFVDLLIAELFWCNALTTNWKILDRIALRSTAGVLCWCFRLIPAEYLSHLTGITILTTKQLKNVKGPLWSQCFLVYVSEIYGKIWGHTLPVHIKKAHSLGT